MKTYRIERVVSKESIIAGITEQEEANTIARVFSSGNEHRSSCLLQIIEEPSEKVIAFYLDGDRYDRT